MTTAAIGRAGEEQKHSSPLNFGNIPQCLYYSKKGSRYLFDITEKYNEVLREKANMYCMRVRCGLSGWCGRGGGGGGWMEEKAAKYKRGRTVFNMPYTQFQEDPRVIVIILLLYSGRSPGEFESLNFCTPSGICVPYT